MAKLSSVVTRCKTSNMSIDKICKIRKYVPIKEKIDFVKKYYETVESHMDDFGEYSSFFVSFVFFYLMVIKTYTDIEIELTYEEFDILQENGIINKIIEVIEEDYSFMLQFIKFNNSGE